MSAKPARSGVALAPDGDIARLARRSHPNRSMRIEHRGVSITGRRENNEDALLELPGRGLYAVADGMGGYEGGEVASKAAIASLQAYCEMLGDDGFGLSSDDERQAVARERIGLAIRIADREVRRRAVGRLRRMGTTLACLAMGNGFAIVAHVGDSRVYRMREGEVAAMTHDHSLLNEMTAGGLVGAGDAARRYRLRNIITQALGQGREVVPDLSVIQVMPGDKFLLCSDGLSDVLDESAIALGLSRKEKAAETLVEAAYEAGSHDNITALVVAVS